MGVSGVSGTEYLAKSSDQPNDDERIADAVAAEVLVPHEDFELRWRKDTSMVKNLSELAGYYKVSMFVVLRRAYEMGIIEHEDFKRQYEELRKNIKPPKPGGGGYGVAIWRNSWTITSTLLASFLEGTVSPTETSALLNMLSLIYRIQQERECLTFGSMPTASSVLIEGRTDSLFYLNSGSS